MGEVLFPIVALPHKQSGSLLLGKPESVTPEALSQGSLSYWGWKDGPQTQVLIEHFVILSLQGSFQNLEPTKPFLSLKYFPWPQALYP